MPYLTHTVTSCTPTPRCPLGIDVIKTEHETLSGAMAQQGTTGEIFCDEITLGRTLIRQADGRWVNDYANPERAAL